MNRAPPALVAIVKCLSWFAAVAIFQACACGSSAVEPDAAVVHVEIAPPTDERAIARRALVERAEGEGYATAAIHVDEAAAPLGAVRLTTRVDGAYPGAGMHTALLAEGLHYGLAGGRDLADLARARRYFETPPDAWSLAELAIIGWLPGSALDPEAPAPALVRDGSSLVLSFGTRPVLGNARDAITITLPPHGPAVIARADRNRPEPTPTDARQALTEALASGDALALMAALRRADEIPPGPEREGLLARAAVLPNEAIAVDALLRLGATDGALVALKRASSNLDQAARNVFLERATSAFGTEFVKRLVP